MQQYGDVVVYQREGYSKNHKTLWHNAWDGKNGTGGEQQEK